MQDLERTTRPQRVVLFCRGFILHFSGNFRQKRISGSYS